MNSLIQYLIESSGCMMLLYLVYWLFMRKDTFFRMNRFYLLGVVCFSTLLPLFPVQFLPLTQAPNMTVILEPVMITSGKIEAMTQNHSSWFEIAAKIYFCGMMLFLVRFLFQLIRMTMMVLRYRVIKYRGFNLVLLDQPCSPYSFFNIIFIDKNEIENNDLEAILVHEQIHIRQGHTLDVIFLEFLTVIFWFNPFVWLIARNLKSIHEYLADEGVLKNGYDKSGYQELIMNKTIGIQISSFTNNFNVSVLKKRIIMMTKNRSTKWMRTKVLLMFPALTVIVVVLSASTYFSEQSRKNNEMQISQSPVLLIAPDKTSEKQILNSTPAAPQAEKEKTVYAVVDKQPSFVGGPAALKKFWEENIQYPEEAKKNKVTGTVYATFVVRADGSVADIKILRGIGHGCDEELVRVIKLMPKWIPGEQKGQKVDVQFNLPVKFMLEEKADPDKEKKTGKSGDTDKH